MLRLPFRLVRYAGHLIMFAGVLDVAAGHRPRALPAPGHESEELSYQERACAGLAHLCLLLNLLTLVGGFLAVVVIGLIGAVRSPFVAQQARQAFFWQLQVWLATLLVATVGHWLWGGWSQLLIIPLELALWLMALLYAVTGALAAVRGVRFRYWGW